MFSICFAVWFYAAGTDRTYLSPDRDALVVSLVDRVRVASHGQRVPVNEVPTPCLRMLPRGEKEEIPVGSAGRASGGFFGVGGGGAGDTTEARCLKRIGDAGRVWERRCKERERQRETGGLGGEYGEDGGAGGDGSGELVLACAELNANVPITGAEYTTRKDLITPALFPLFSLAGKLVGGQYSHQLSPSRHQHQRQHGRGGSSITSTDGQPLASPTHSMSHSMLESAVVVELLQVSCV